MQSFRFRWAKRLIDDRGEPFMCACHVRLLICCAGYISVNGQGSVYCISLGLRSYSY